MGHARLARQPGVQPFAPRPEQGERADDGGEPSGAIAEVVGLLREIRDLLVTERAEQPVTLAACGETVTRAQIARALGLAPRSLDRYAALQRRTGQRILPDPLDGFRNRYDRRVVERWVRTELWRLDEARHVLKMMTGAAPGRPVA